MQKEQVKELLLKTTEQLLMERESPDELTSRLIAAQAGVNPAMINYCFRSKDELLSEAIGKMIEKAAARSRTAVTPDAPAIGRLWDFMWMMCEAVFKFRSFTKAMVPYLLLQGDLDAPLYILPLLREHFGKQKSEAEIRIIAYELIAFLQLVFYRDDAFSRYVGAELMNPEGIRSLLLMQFRLLLKGDFTLDTTN